MTERLQTLPVEKPFMRITDLSFAALFKILFAAFLVLFTLQTVTDMLSFGYGPVSLAAIGADLFWIGWNSVVYALICLIALKGLMLVVPFGVFSIKSAPDQRTGAQDG
ncbi:MAG: hypothetical protein AAGG79_06855 [Pseudomonadota bacterium]